MFCKSNCGKLYKPVYVSVRNVFFRSRYRATYRHSTNLTGCKKLILLRTKEMKRNSGISTLLNESKQGIDQHIFNRKSISRKITHPSVLIQIERI